MKYLKNNKGLSLVELIVAFAISAIAGVAVFGLMSAGSNHFNSTGKDVGLQYEQQVVVNRLRDSLIEASNAISYDDSTKTLLVYSQKDMGITGSGMTTHTYKYEMTKIFLSGSELQYASGLFDDLNPDNLNGLSSSLLGEDVKDIEFFLDEVEKGQIKFNITFEVSGKEISSQQVVALRNAVKGVTPSGEVLLVSEDTFFNGTIRYVTIYRDDHAFTQNETTDIGLNGEAIVSVPFSYIVSAYETTREYAAVWSIENPADGISVDASGVVTVDPTKISAGSVFILKCTSVDDTSKYQTIRLNILNDGVYPQQLISVKNGGSTEYVGYRDYIIYPEIRYTDGSIKYNGDLCTWRITVLSEDNRVIALPLGSTFELDEASHRYTFRATSALNGCKVRFYATVKAPTIAGTKLPPESLTLNISGIKDASENNELSLNKQDDIYNRRGSEIAVMASWEKTDAVSNYTYHWKIEENGSDVWGKTGDDRSDFGKTVFLKTTGLTSEDDGWYRSAPGSSYVYVNSESWLDWSKEYQVKLLCYATDTRGNRFGIGNDLEENWTGPVETIIAYKPVKVILRPMTVYHENNSKTLDLVDSLQLKRAVKVDRNGNYVNDHIDGIEDKTVRLFEVMTTGVAFSATNTGTVTISSQASTPANETVNNTVFTFYNKVPTIIPKNGTPVSLQSFFSQYPRYYSNGYIVGFTADMNSNNFKNYMAEYDDPTSTVDPNTKPKYVNVNFKASDSKGNKTGTYFLTGNNVYSDNSLKSMSEVKYEIVYDPAKLNDQNYVEIRGQN